MTAHVIAAVVCAVVAGTAGWFVPRLVAAVPEPPSDDPPVDPPVDQPDDQPDDPAPGPPKELYVEVAARRHLGAWSAVVAAVAGAAVGGTLGWDWALLFLVPFAPFGAALGAIDWRTRLLPTWLLAPAYPAVVVLIALAGVLGRDWYDLRRAVFGWLVIGGFYLLMWLISPRMMGYGDVRLAGLLGLMLGYLGWAEIVVGLIAPFLVFSVPAALALLVRRRSFQPVPFGPAMLASAVLVVPLAHPIADWYLGRL